MDQIMYYKKAQNAFEEKDYKRCVILLKRTSLSDSNTITLFVKACYTAWISHDTNLTLQEIQESYSLLFSSTNGINIPSFEFVRLSHIYLKIGSLSGALKTLQYAGFSGHFNSSIVILQTWTVLRKLGEVVESKRFFLQLCEMIPMEIPQEHENGFSFLPGTDIPLSVCYLHCGYQLRYESVHSKSSEVKSKLIQKSEAMLVEAYTYAHLAHPFNKQTYLTWIYTSQTWVDIAIYLEQTPCILLAEESYWIAYLCDSLSDRRAEDCVRLVQENSRPQEMLAMCERLYGYNHWNLYSRNKLLELDEATYHPIFLHHSHLARRVQALFRGYQTRNHWDRTLVHVKTKKEIYQKRLEKAQKMRRATLQRQFRLQLRTWRKNAIESKQLRFHSARTLQLAYLSYRARVTLSQLKYRTHQANRKYLIACELHHSFYNIQILKEWHKIWKVTRNNRSVDLLKLFLKTTKWSVKMKRMGLKLTALLKIRKKYCYKKMFKIWWKRFQTKREKRAVCILRFWLRSKMKRKGRREKEREVMKREREKRGGKPIDLETILKQIEESKEMKRIVYRLDAIYMKREWKKWREQYKAKQMLKGQIRIATQLPYIYRQVKMKRKLNYYRARREFLESSSLKRYHVSLLHTLIHWRKLTSVNRIQRQIRIYLAKCRVRYRLYQLQRTEYLYKRSLSHFMFYYFDHWIKRITSFQILKRHAGKCIMRWWRRAQQRRFLTVHIKRKYYLVSFLNHVNFLYLKKCFGQLSRQVFAQHQIQALTILFKHTHHLYLAHLFPFLRKQCQTQTKLQNYLNQVYPKVLERKFYSPRKIAHWVVRSTSRRYDCRDLSVRDSNHKLIKISFPSLLHRRKRLIDSEYLSLYRSFLLWIYSYQYRRIVGINTAHKLAPTVLSTIYQTVSLNWYSCCYIQKYIRRYLATLRYHRIRQHHYIYSEKTSHLIALRNHRLLHLHFQKMCAGWETVYRARLKLQSWFRQLYTQKKVLVLKKDESKRQSKERVIRRKREKKTLQTIMGMIQLHYLFKITFRDRRVESDIDREERERNDDEYSNYRQRKREKEREQLPAVLRRIDRFAPLSPSSRSGPSLLRSSSTFDGTHVGKFPSLSQSNSTSSLSLDFTSQEYHRHLFSLKQNHVFIFNPSRSSLRYNEVIYLLQLSKILFWEGITETLYLSELIRYFEGNKIIFCGGIVTKEGVKFLQTFLMTREKDMPITFHLSDVKMKMKFVENIVNCFFGKQSQLREISVDVDSVGILGICSFIAALRGNQTVKSFIIKLDRASFLPCMGECVKSIVTNSTLQEIRILGSPIPSYILEGLSYCIQFGLCNLTALEFDYYSSDKEAMEVFNYICSERQARRIGYNIIVKSVEYVC